MTALAAPDGAYAGIIAFYSLIHVPRDGIAQVLSELRRVLRPDGALLLAFHIGDDTLHLDEWWGYKVCVDFHFYRPGEMTDDLRAAGFDVEEVVEREPYVEHQSRRAYVFARRPELNA